MKRTATKTFKTALRSIRREQRISLQELGARIEADASHVFKLENGKDVMLSTMLRLANALNSTVYFGPYAIVADAASKKRSGRKKVVK